MASRGRGARERGANFERAIVKQLNAWGIRAKRIRSGNTLDPGDIATDYPLHIDCKDHDRWRVLDWFDTLQGNAERECLTPLLILKRQGTSDHSQDLCVITMEEYWTLKKHSSEPSSTAKTSGSSGEPQALEPPT